MNYFQLYTKYKRKYLMLKAHKQFGGEVIFDLMYDEDENDNALDDIFIEAIERDGLKIKYRKTIKVDAGQEKGSLYSKSYETGITNGAVIDRGVAEKLLDDINHVWTLPAVDNRDFELFVRHGDNEWSNTKGGNRQTRSRNVIKDKNNIYQDIITDIVAFDGDPDM